MSILKPLGHRTCCESWTDHTWLPDVQSEIKWINTVNKYECPTCYTFPKLWFQTAYRTVYHWTHMKALIRLLLIRVLSITSTQNCAWENAVTWVNMWRHWRITIYSTLIHQPPGFVIPVITTRSKLRTKQLYVCTMQPVCVLSSPI
jgi:hypothetical protein